MIAFAKRNLKLYLRDRSAVLFSLLAVFIVIGLYVLFLGDVWTNGLQEFPNARELMDNWVIAGVLAITSVTTTLGMLGTMVRDKTEKIEKDFYAAPIKKNRIAGGYLLSAYLVGLFMTLLALAAGELYIVSNKGAWLTPAALWKTLAVIPLTCLMNTAMVLFLVSLFRSMSAFTTAGTIVGTLIGFLTGIYLPIGMYPEAVQWIIKLFPVSHAALLFRNIMMDACMEEAFRGASAEVVLSVKKQLGIIYQAGAHSLPAGASALVVTGTFLLFLALACMRIARKNG